MNYTRRHCSPRQTSCRKKSSGHYPLPGFLFRCWLLLLFSFTNCVTALSSSSSSSSSSCKIVGTPGGTTQYLPTSYIETFGRWIVVNHQLTPLLPSTSSTSSSSAVPSPVFAVQATLDILVKSGTPTYVMAGLQVQQSQHSTSPASSSYSYSTPPWTAHQWVTFGSVVEPDFRVVLFQGNGNENDGENEPKILAVATTDDIRLALEDLGLALQQQQSCSNSNDDSESSPPSPSLSSSLEQGFHIVSIPLQMTKTSRDVVTSSSIDSSQQPADDDDSADSTTSRGTEDSSNSKKLDWIPVNHHDTRTSSSSMTKNTILLTCLATAEVNARELLSLDPTLLEMTVTSILQVPFSSIYIQQHD